jgi:hypothetical protein
MNIKVKRRYKGSEYTIGSLYIDGEYFCDTMEPPFFDTNQTDSIAYIKTTKKGNTAIPTGTYNITFDVVSEKFKNRSWAKFCNGKLPRLLNVPGFEGILIHVGNKASQYGASDTQGCLLVGENKVKGQVINSTVTFEKLYNKIKGNNVTITIE